jgi:serine phosphatase RsbU (regulator of sigma subunit)
MAIKWGTGSDGSTVTIDRHSESMLFPIKAGDRRLGHVYVELPSAGRKASDEAIEFLSLLTRQVGLLWENLELQAIRHANAELNRELSAARQIQLQLFPRQRDIHPRLDIAAENIPALGVSGDYYDFQLVDPNRVLFILADVMGHGLSAALLMAGVQAVFRTGVRAGWDLPHLDLHLHDMVEATGHGETFVTGILGLCDVTHASLSLLAAGHPWPSICCEDTFVERDPQACSLPWGVVVPRSPQPFVVTLPESNWSVVAYTDGIAESLGPGGRSYGAHRLIEFHRRYRDRSADELCEEILSDVLRSSDDSTPQNDDITLLVLRNSSRAQPSLPQTL